MNITKKINVILFCFTILLLSVITVNAETDKTSKHQYAGIEHAVTELSESGNYRFTLYSKPSPIPLKKIHSWILKVENNDGNPVTNAKLFINGGMPAHRHGFPTKPVVKKYLGNGEYLVEGIKFTMPGYWEMRFTMSIKNKRERVVFKINLY